MKKAVITSSLFALPFLAHAQFTSVEGVVLWVRNVINLLIPLVIAVAILIFLVGVLEFIRAKGDEDRKEGQQKMLWGIIGLFVMVSVWGLVNILVRTANLDTNAPGSDIENLTEDIPFQI